VNDKQQSTYPARIGHDLPMPVNGQRYPLQSIVMLGDLQSETTGHNAVWFLCVSAKAMADLLCFIVP